jgi:hypothetical protein
VRGFHFADKLSKQGDLNTISPTPFRTVERFIGGTVRFLHAYIQNRNTGTERATERGPIFGLELNRGKDGPQPIHNHFRLAWIGTAGQASTTIVGHRRPVLATRLAQILAMPASGTHHQT